MTAMGKKFYQLELTQRRRLLADQGFVRERTRVWAHPDGRAVGEGVAAALTDSAFCRFLQLAEDAVPEVDESSASSFESTLTDAALA